METLIYTLKSAAVLSLFYLIYFIVLRKDTYFTTKRHFLIVGIISAVLLPFLVFTKTIFQTASVSEIVYTSKNVINNTMIPVETETIDIWQIALFIYLAGVIFMLFRFTKQITSLITLITTYVSEKNDGFHYIKVNNNIPPFSFFNYIVFNPELHSVEETKMIIKHEQIHANQWHSIDILLANLLLIFQWMNPIAWLFKKSLEENLEFLADSETIQNVSCRKSYQLTLVKTSTSQTQLALTNNFYQSFIKKRIIMLHKRETKSFHQFKLLLVLPFLALFLWSFNMKEEVKYIDPDLEEGPAFYFSESIPEEKASITSEKKEEIPLYTKQEKSSKSINKDNKITVSIDKNTTDAELKKISKLFKDNYNATLKFSGVKRNSKSEITDIKIKMKSDKSNANFNESNSDGIHAFNISYDAKKGSISIGNNNHHDIHFTSKDGNTFAYSSNEGGHSKVNTWISDDGKTVHEYKYDSDEIHEGDDDHEVIIINNGNHDHESDNDFIFIDENGKVTKDHDVKVIKNNGNNMFIMGDDKDMLIMIDGKKATKKQMENLEGGTIMDIEVIKGEEAVKRYGKKAKDGVILINTKEK